MVDAPFKIRSADWEVTTLGEAARRGGGDIQTGPFGSQLHASDYVSEGIPSVMPQNIGDNRIVETAIARITEADAARLAKYRLRAGDIVYSRRGDVERRALVRPANSGWLCGTGCLRVRLGTGYIDPEYAAYYLGHPNVREWVVQHAVGATMPNLNTGILSALPFVLPQLAEQRAIASVLALLDDKIELNRRMNETLEAMAQAIFRDWFVYFRPVRRKLAGAADPIEIMGGLVADPVRATELAGSQPAALDDEKRPVGWDARPLSDLTTELRRGIGPKYVELGGVLVLNQKCIRNREVSFGPSRRHDEHAKGVAGRTLLNGDVLVNSTGVGTLGRVAQLWGLDQRVIVDSHVTVVRARSTDFSAIYLGLALGLREQEIVALGEGSTGQTELSRERLGRMEMVVPDKAVLDQFDAICGPLIERIQANRQEAATLAETRDYLLPRLMSGEVRVRDAAREIAA